MNKLAVLLAVWICFTLNLYSQGPKGNDFGFGIILGEPTGLTGKIWTNSENAVAFSVGNSYFGSLRITGDYLWHINAFKSRIVSLYTGPGLVVGFGESGGWIYKKKGDYYWVRKESEIGIAARGVFGLNIIPKNTPLEFFAELGVLVGLVPKFGSGVEGAIGFRFYP